MSAPVVSLRAPAAPRWRPLGPSDLDWARDIATVALDRWQDEWLHRRNFNVTAVEQLAPGFRHDGAAQGARWCAGAQWCADSDPSAWNHHALSAMGLNPRTAAPVPDALLAPVKDAMLDGLLARLSGGFLGDDAPAPNRTGLTDTWSLPHGGLRLSLGSARDPRLLDLYLGAEPIWARRLDSVPSPTGAKRPVAIAAALAESPLSLSAILGTCELTALQLAGLSIGDVLATSQPLQSAIELRLHAGEQAPRTIARGRPGRSQQRLSIALTSIEQ